MKKRRHFCSLNFIYTQAETVTEGASNAPSTRQCLRLRCVFVVAARLNQKKKKNCPLTRRARGKYNKRRKHKEP